MEMEALTRAVMGRIFIELEASGRHAHVTKEQAMTLFGHALTPKRELSQPGQFLANERVTVIGPKGEFRNVAVLGPERPEAQVEVSLTDGKTLGITPPVRLSGDVKDTPGAILVGPQGRVELTHGVIAAKRHIHMPPGWAWRTSRWCGCRPLPSGLWYLRKWRCGCTRGLRPGCTWITTRPMPAALLRGIWGEFCNDPGAAHWK